jgi:serine/threonine-protein kinase HipA
MNEIHLFIFAHLDGQFVPAGRITLAEQNVELLASTFAYGSRYLNRPQAFELDPIGLSLKNKAETRGRLLVPPNGLTFFGGIRDAAPDAWGRRVIEARRQVAANSLPESMYLLEASSERIGALDIRDALTAPAHMARGSIHSLNYLMEAANRIEAGLKIPESLADIFLAGSGLGGMRPKATVRDDDEILWLAKFASRDDHILNVPMIEYGTLRLAALCGLVVPETQLLQLQDKHILLIRRFDRQWLEAIEHRMPLISALTLLACPEMDSPHKSYMDIAAAMHRYCATAQLKSDIKELYARMIFNIFVSNDDDHLRNHAFLWDGMLRGWRLSPLYDVMPRATLASERFLHLGVGPKGRIANLDNAYAAKERFGILSPDAIAIINRVWTVVWQWKVHFESFGVESSQIERISPAFRHIDQISTAELRKLL